MAEILKNGLLFLNVHEDLSKRISSGEFPLDCQLPTEAELVKRYGVSITTIRKAVQKLADEGIVAKRQGMGTFVTSYPGRRPGNTSSSDVLNIAAFLPDTARLTKEGDSRHWALNLRRLNGICAAAARRHCQVFVHGLNEQVDLEKVQGVIIIASYAYGLESEDARLKLSAELESKGLTYVTISEFDPRFASRLWVAEMTETEFFKATSSLIEKGHRRIALLGPKLSWENPRYAGYRKALAARGLPFDETLVFDNPEADERSGKAACAALLERLPQLPDALFCTTDLQAYGAISYLASRGIIVPRDISVLGVDNLAESASCSPSLSSLEFSGPDLGEAALELLLAARNGSLPGGRMVSCNGSIIWRESVRDRNKQPQGDL